MGGKLISTDKLAKHPGRPWKKDPNDIPPHVRQHYTSLSVEGMIQDVLLHYRNVWSMVELIIQDFLKEERKKTLIIEGSALWPTFVNDLKVKDTLAVWLTAKKEVFRTRMYDSSQFERLAPPEQFLVNQFLARGLRFDELMMREIRRLGLTYIEVDQLSKQALMKKVLSVN